MAKSRFQQYMLIGIGIMVAIGFSGVFTYGNMINSGSNTQNTDRQQINAKLPSQNYVKGSFNLSVRQQAYLAVNKQVVFVNAFYENDSAIYSNLESLPQEFNNRVYINVLNRSESTVGTNYKLKMPSALIVGGQPTTRAPYTLKSTAPNRTAIVNGICASMRQLGNLGATCYT